MAPACHAATRAVISKADMPVMLKSVFSVTKTRSGAEDSHQPFITILCIFKSGETMTFEFKEASDSTDRVRDPSRAAADA